MSNMNILNRYYNKKSKYVKKNNKDNSKGVIEMRDIVSIIGIIAIFAIGAIIYIIKSKQENKSLKNTREVSNMISKEDANKIMDLLESIHELNHSD